MVPVQREKGNAGDELVLTRNLDETKKKYFEIKINFILGHILYLNNLITRSFSNTVRNNEIDFRLGT